MGRSKSVWLSDILSDRFSDVWQLLSETTLFLSRTKEFDTYEAQLREWRLKLQISKKDQEVRRRIRSEVTELRKNLRLQGYDLSLVKQTLRFEGFRNDACIAENFKRVVLFITDDDIYWLSGEENHIVLADFLDKQLGKISAERRLNIRSRHYLWYRRQKNELVLSGSDTEQKEDFEYLRALGEANTLLLLSRLKGLR
jgi:hypothetical protein